jgi:putative redox protein
VVEARLNWIDSERFVASASSGHAMVIDSDRERNTAAGPMELVLMGLCACTATDVVTILRKKREPFTGLEVRAEAERAKHPPTVYTAIKLIYSVTGQVSRKAVEDAVRLSEEKYCGVAAMLKSTAHITMEIHLSSPGAPETGKK